MSLAPAEWSRNTGYTRAVVFFGPSDGPARVVAPDWSRPITSGFGSSGELVLYFLDPQAGFGEPVPLGAGAGSGLSAAADDAGNAIILFDTGSVFVHGPGLHAPVHMRTLSRDGTLGPLTEVTGPEGNARQTSNLPLVVVGAGGNGHVIWAERASGGSFPPARIMARSITTDGVLGEPFTVIDRIGVDKVGSIFEAAAFDDGRTILVWPEFSGGSRQFSRSTFAIRARILEPARVANTALITRKRGVETAWPTVAVRGSQARVIWRHGVPDPRGRVRRGFRELMYGLRSRAVSADGKLGKLGTIVRAKTGRRVSGPFFASNGQEILATWVQSLPRRPAVLVSKFP